MALGATRWESIFAVILPTASRGIFGGMVLAFGRALGETMALAMLVGNANRISVSLFSPANTLAALLANNFPEAGPKEVGILMYAALVLLAITLIVNIYWCLNSSSAPRAARRSYRMTTVKFKSNIKNARRSVCRRRLRATGTLLTPPPYLVGFSAQWPGHSHDFIGAGALIQRALDAALAWWQAFEPGGFHPTSSFGNGVRRRLWKRNRRHGSDGQFGCW